jgi:hypothetical protein
MLLARTNANETTTAKIAKSKLKQNEPTVCNINGGNVDRSTSIDPRTADNMVRLVCDPTKIGRPELSNCNNLK